MSSTTIKNGRVKLVLLAPSKRIYLYDIWLHYKILYTYCCRIGIFFFIRLRSKHKGKVALAFLASLLHSFLSVSIKLIPTTMCILYFYCNLSYLMKNVSISWIKNKYIYVTIQGNDITYDFTIYGYRLA